MFGWLPEMTTARPRALDVKLGFCHIKYVSENIGYENFMMYSFVRLLLKLFLVQRSST